MCKDTAGRQIMCALLVSQTHRHAHFAIVIGFANLVGDIVSSSLSKCCTLHRDTQRDCVRNESMGVHLERETRRGGVDRERGSEEPKIRGLDFGLQLS